MRTNESLKNEIAEFVNEIDNNKVLVAILKFVKIMCRNMRRGVFDEEWLHINDRQNACKGQKSRKQRKEVKNDIRLYMLRISEIQLISAI